MYFLLTEQEELLFALLGEPIGLPLTVYDPIEEEAGSVSGRRPDLLSEMRQIVHHYDVAQRTDKAARENLLRVKRVQALVDSRRIAIIKLTDAELRLAARLQDPQTTPEFGLKAPLGPGEAACVAIAQERGLVIATDDTDALRALENLQGRPDFPFERIRKLLIWAATSGLITRGDANFIHSQMRKHGFWDKGEPFP
jgi:predicted nucleic acid-binding protein